MAEMKDVAEQVVRSYDERQRRLKKLRTATSNLRKTYREAQAAVREELSDAQAAWQKAAATLQKKRHQKRSK